MLRWNKACFCEHCLEGFRESMGLDIDYKKYLHARGIYTNQELFERSWKKDVPLWDDYWRFQERSAIRYLKRLRCHRDPRFGWRAGLFRERQRVSA